MTDKEVRKLSRTDLLKLLIEQTEENERLSARNSQLEQTLSSRTITLENAGSIAEAAMQLTDVFKQAQSAADVYLESIRQKQAQLDDLLQQAQETREKVSQECAEKEAQTEKKCQELERRTRAVCLKLLEQAKQGQMPPAEEKPPAPEEKSEKISFFLKKGGRP